MSIKAAIVSKSHSNVDFKKIWGPYTRILQA